LIAVWRTYLNDLRCSAFDQLGCHRITLLALLVAINPHNAGDLGQQFHTEGNSLDGFFCCRKDKGSA